MKNKIFTVCLACLVSSQAFANSDNRPSQRLAEGNATSTFQSSQSNNCIHHFDDCNGAPDCDQCPNDPNKTEPGACGCGYSDVDSDGDSTPDCLDSCPEDPTKVRPGRCGCGTSDDTPNCVPPSCDDDPNCVQDECPDDPNKTEAGVCGCGTPDTDSDGDNTADCIDACPNDPNKVEAGACGCGTLDIDSDGDNTADCVDACPNDPNKVDAGACGCGTPDTDSDNDGSADCIDGCPNDPNKVEPGTCGCGIADDTPRCGKQCTFYEVDITQSKKQSTADNVIQRDEASAELSCLSDMIEDANKICTDEYIKSHIANQKLRDSAKFSSRYDDCVAGRVTGNYFTVIGTDKVGGNGYCTSAKKSLAAGVGSGKDTYLVACKEGYFYMDQECGSVDYQQVEEENVCGKTMLSYLLTGSPISLIWEPGYNINTDISFANFRLNPADNNAWTTWKASEKAPLLVYDPEKTNSVKDATQLFGNWTFGGKRTASLVAKQSSSAWANGFEALATIDSDQNGKVDGSELNDLALWFDKNRNGISENGEVVRLKDTGVTALFYQGYKKDALSSDLRLEVGYERNVNGNTVQGASIDWYGNYGASKSALANYYSFLRDDISDDDFVNKVKETTLNTSNDKFTGTWKWFIDDNASTPNGYLIFAEDKESNSVTGYSFVERRFSSSPKNFLKSMINFFSLEGETSVKNGINTMSFSLTDRNRMTISDVTLSEDGKELHGTSRITVARGAEIASYSWTAKKM